MKEKSRQNLKKLLIYLGVGTGITILSLAAPQLPFLLLKAYFKGKKFDKNKFNRSLRRLEQKNLVRYQKNSSLVKILLTKQGREIANSCRFDLLEIKKPKKWDKKWRIVIFDVPHYKKKSRDVLRWKLKTLGFFQYQKSVFIHPYNCEAEIEEITDLYGVSENVKLILADKISDEDLLKNKFNLR